MAASPAGSNRCARRRRSTRSCCGSSGSRNSGIHALLVHYGLVALFLGAGFEGETAVVAGGLLAHKGLFSLPGAMAAASLGSFVADQLFFTAGRYFRDRPFVARQRARPAFARVLGMLERYPVAFIFAFRFIYGIRTISPIAIGTSRVREPVFLAVNAVAAVVWGCAFTAIGYAFGRAFERLLHRLQPSGTEVAVAVGVVVLIALAVHLVRRRRSHAARRDGVDSAAPVAESRAGPHDGDREEGA